MYKYQSNLGMTGLPGMAMAADAGNVTNVAWKLLTVQLDFGQDTYLWWIPPGCLPGTGSRIRFVSFVVFHE
jgi:hypothetical protein